MRPALFISLTFLFVARESITESTRDLERYKYADQINEESFETILPVNILKKVFHRNFNDPTVAKNGTSDECLEQLKFLVEEFKRGSTWALRSELIFLFFVFEINNTIKKYFSHGPFAACSRDNETQGNINRCKRIIVSRR